MGANIDPQTQLTQAVDQIAEQFRIRRSSSQYLTADVKKDTETRDFLNQVLEIETDLSFNALVAELKAIERSLGREAGNKKQVALDLDVLTYGAEVFVAHNKPIPSPDLIKYHYIAQPLAEMAPDFRHPANGLSIEEIVKNITDSHEF
jgi:2-amino-4-hydroxy-6-hydroxymethyldihydropteridine diphosphokinase